MKLHTAGTAQNFTKPIVARVTTIPLPLRERHHTVLLAPAIGEAPEDLYGYAGVITRTDLRPRDIVVPVVHSVREIDNLQSDYIVVSESW